MDSNAPRTDTHTLFRPRAVAAAAGSQIGEPLRTHWRGVWICTLAAIAAVAGLLVFVSTVDYAPSHRVAAYTDAPQGLVRLRAPADGLTVAKLAVREGALVRKGDLLAVLGSDPLRPDGGSRHTSERQRLADEQAALQREIDAARSEATAQHAVIEQRITGLRAEEASLRADLRAGERLLGSLTAQSTQVAALAAQGFYPSLQAAQKNDEATAQASRVAATRTALARVARDIALAESERRVVDTRLTSAVESRRRAAAELERVSVLADADAERAVRAPQDGVVSSSLIAEGQSVDLGQMLFTITPQGEPLALRLLVPARASAHVRPGMAVRFTLYAYPQEKFGLFDAIVQSVSNAPALQSDVAAPARSDEPVYLVLARLPAQLRAPDGAPLVLKPGMQGTAMVPIEQRRLIEWMFEPLLRRYNDNRLDSAAPLAVTLR